MCFEMKMVDVCHGLRYIVIDDIILYGYNQCIFKKAFDAFYMFQTAVLLKYPDN